MVWPCTCLLNLLPLLPSFSGLHLCCCVNRPITPAYQRLCSHCAPCLRHLHWCLRVSSKSWFLRSMWLTPGRCSHWAGLQLPLYPLAHFSSLHRIDMCLILHSQANICFRGNSSETLHVIVYFSLGDVQMDFVCLTISWTWSEPPPCHLHTVMDADSGVYFPEQCFGACGPIAVINSHVMPLLSFIYFIFTPFIIKVLYMKCAKLLKWRYAINFKIVIYLNYENTLYKVLLENKLAF